MTELLFFAILTTEIIIGFECARHTSATEPLWVRIILLSPALTAMWTMSDYVRGEYVPYYPDILRAGTTMLLYLTMLEYPCKILNVFQTRRPGWVHKIGIKMSLYADDRQTVIGRQKKDKLSSNNIEK